MIAENKINVLIVEDSNVVRASIVQLVNSDPALQVMGTAGNGCEALRFVTKRRPDVILMDVEMPVMDGMEAARLIMETKPVPIIFCSARLDKHDSKTIVQLLDTGAVACVETPRWKAGEKKDESAEHLLQTVKLMSEVKLVRRWPSMRRAEERNGVESTVYEGIPKVRVDIIGIGASTGGPPVLRTILEELPNDFSVPILVVQHIARGFLGGLADWLNLTTGMQVEVAEHGVTPQAGHVYLAADDHHMELSEDGTISLVDGELDNGVRPSVSHLFNSLARVCGPSAVGVLLTGMGKDGAEALKVMRQQGAHTIVQDRKSSAIHGMPGVAIAIGAATCVLPAGQIAQALVSVVNQQNQLQGEAS